MNVSDSRGRKEKCTEKKKTQKKISNVEDQTVAFSIRRFHNAPAACSLPAPSVCNNSNIAGVVSRAIAATRPSTLPMRHREFMRSVTSGPSEVDEKVLRTCTIARAAPPPRRLTSAVSPPYSMIATLVFTLKQFTAPSAALSSSSDPSFKISTRGRTS